MTTMAVGSMGGDSSFIWLVLTLFTLSLGAERLEIDRHAYAAW
jgi:hypothetical protein